MVLSCVALVEISELILMLYYEYTWPIIYLFALATWHFQFSIISYRLCLVLDFTTCEVKRFSHKVFQSWPCTCTSPTPREMKMEES